MYITEDTGKIFLDTSDTAEGRIILNSEASEYVRKVTVGADGNISIESLSYDDLIEYDGRLIALASNFASLQGQITENKEDIEEITTTTLPAEKNRAETAEAALDKAIKDEITRAKKAEEGIVTNANAIEAHDTLIANNTAAHKATNITLTGDVAGSATIDTNNKLTVVTDIADSGVVAGSYGTEIKTGDTIVPLGHSSKFTVPNLTVAADGRLTAAGSKTYQLPSSEAIETALNDMRADHEAINVTLSGDVTGSATIDADNKLSITTDIANSGVTAGAYGPVAAETIAHGNSFVVPQITVGADGRITAATSRNITLPGVTSLESSIAANTTAHKATNVALSGDVTGSATIDASNKISITTDIANSGVTAGTYGLEAAATPAHGESFTVPYIKVQADGRVTKAGEFNVTLPSVSDLSTNISNNATNIANEITRATQAEADLQAAIEAEEARATEAEKGIATNANAIATNAEAIEAQGTLISDNTTAHKATNIALSGDVTGSATINATTNKLSVTTTLKNSGVTAGSYGPSANATPAHKASFNVPYITVDAKGRVTSASTKTVTLPSVDALSTSIASNTAAIEDNTEAIGVASGENTEATGLHLKIETETARATEAENTLTTNLNTEIARAKAAEKVNADSITSHGTEISNIKANHNAINIALSGDVTGSATITSNKLSVTTDIAASGVTAGTYGLEAATTPAHGGNFLVPYVKVQADGRVTEAGEYKVTLPSVTSLETNIAANTTAHQAINIALTGDVTGSATIDTNNKLSVTTDIAASGVTAGTYGLEAAASPAHGGKFLVPYVTVAADGRVTKAGEYNITLPSVTAIETNVSNNTTAIGVIQDTDTDKSMRTVATEVVNELVINSSDDNIVNKLTEIVSWINDDESGAIDTLADHGTRITTLESTASSHATSIANNTSAHKAINVALSGDVTGSATINTSNKVAITADIAASGVTAGSYGPSANATPAYGATFNVPYITVAADGRVTAASTKTVKIPASDNTTYKAGTGLSLSGTTFNHSNSITAGTAGVAEDYTASWGASFAVPHITYDDQGHITAAGVRNITMPANPNSDTKVNVTLGTTTKAYLLGTSTTPTSTAAGVTAIADTGVYLDTTAGKLTAGSFAGNGAALTSLNASNISSGTLAKERLATSGATAGTYGAAASPAHGGTFAIPSITVDTYGRVTNATTVNITLPADNNTDTKVKQNAAITTDGAYPVILGYSTATTAVTNTVNKCAAITANPSTGTLAATKVTGAVWNDYAEYRESNITEPGRVICENGDDTLSLAIERLQPGANVVSDTFGFAIGETKTAKTPIAVSGRVLVYTYEDRETYKPGDAVCAAPGGTVSKMSREEIMTYPERIVGTVSAVPSYETWGENNVPVNGRIWIKVR